jgi:hypothetical protein
VTLNELPSAEAMLRQLAFTAGIRKNTTMSQELSNRRFCDERWEEWYRMTPLERWHESQKLWQFYLAMGGSLDPEPDSQSPFYPFVASGSSPSDGRSGLRVIRRSGI